jgi:predicted lysophospholipase L1 biosynthesis ABC-type transport system permease subunit
VVVAVQGESNTVASALRDQLSGHTVLEIQQPAGLAAWSSLRRLPVLLGLLLGLLAMASLTHGLAMSNQLHRRDLAVLNSLGMRTRQLTSVVCWQAAAIVGASLVIGVPLGLIAGRAAWRILVERMGVTSAAGLAPGPILIATAAAVAAVAALTIVVARSAGRHNHAAELRGE